MRLHMIGWFFMPYRGEHLNWVAPPNYIRAAVGELRLKPVTDNPMDDHRFYEPGWKRAVGLDQVLTLREPDDV